jgi:hypothetical protein
MRGIANRLDMSEYCVAENRFWVSRKSNTEKAPVPIPEVRVSKPVATSMRGLFTGLIATTT